MTESDTFFPFDNTYFRELEGFYAPVQGAKAPAPSVLYLNTALAKELKLNPAEMQSRRMAEFLSGASNPVGGQPLAMAYAGHQFGNYSPQLGDGRALLIGELVDCHGRRRDLHLKGSGRTPFSRGGDGKAGLEPVLREYLMGEAMHALGVPTTRALAAVSTGEKILRHLSTPGAVLARVASSHLRVGTFQYFAAAQDPTKIRTLADYAIARHYPELLSCDNPYLGLLQKVGAAQASLVAQWVSVGFVHGVMNTDNVTVSGETIDYGPCAFIDSYDPDAVFSSIDQGGRYAYGQQAHMAQWNLARFAETLLTLIDPDDTEHAVQLATEEIGAFPSAYQAQWLACMRSKLGLSKQLPEDEGLINALHTLMEEQAADFSQMFRALSRVVLGDQTAVRALLSEPAAADTWLADYKNRCAQEDNTAAERAASMDGINPLYIPRNHKVEEALEKASEQDMRYFDTLLQAVSNPFEAQDGLEDYTQPAPDSFGPHITYCGT